MVESDLSSEVNATTVLPAASGVDAAVNSNGNVVVEWTNNDDSADGGIDVERKAGTVTVPSAYNKGKPLDVVSVSGSPTIDSALPIKITSGDDSTTGTSKIVLDWSDISSKSDIAVYDENGNLLDYWVENFDASAETAVVHVYRDWVRDGSTQAQIAYGDGPSDQSVTSSTVFDKESDLQAGWALNEDNGDALDLTSNNNDGTVNGATQGVTGQVDGAYDFDGTDDYVDFGDKSIWKASDSFVASIWVKADEVPFSNFTEIIIHSSDTTTNGWGLFGNPRSNGDKLRFQMQGSSNDFIDIFITADTWYHIAGVYDSANSVLTVYKNGTEVNSVSNVTINTTSTDLYLGGGASLANFDGITDNFHIHSSVLSADDITATYDASKATPDFFSQQAGVAASSFSDVATGLSPSATSYTDSTVSSGESYQYRIERNTDHATAVSNTTDITT